MAGRCCVWHRVGARLLPRRAFQADALARARGLELTEGFWLRWKVQVWAFTLIQMKVVPVALPRRCFTLCTELAGENRASPWNRSIRRTIGNSVSDSWAGRLFHLTIYVTFFFFLFLIPTACWLFWKKLLFILFMCDPKSLDQFTSSLLH